MNELREVNSTCIAQDPIGHEGFCIYPVVGLDCIFNS